MAKTDKNKNMIKSIKIKVNYVNDKYKKGILVQWWNERHCGWEKMCKMFKNVING